MAFIFPNESDVFSLSATLGKGNMTLRVICPQNATGFAALTAVNTTADFQFLSAGGHNASGTTVFPSAWAIPYLSAGSAEASATSAVAASGYIFAFTAACLQSASGYLLETSTNKLFMVEYFTDGPYILSNAGDTITIKPVVRST